MKNKHKVRFITASAMIAALYVAMTLISGSVGLAYGPIQIRISEALCILPMFLPAAIPGLTVGCAISNLFSPLGVGMIADLIFGSFATFLGAYGAWKLREKPLLAPIPTVVANTVIVPLVLAFFYGAQESIPYLMLTVGIGEVIAAYILGLILYRALLPIKGKLSNLS